ncbi:MAG: ComEC/Rec2 family competence protein [Clostridia bacterium]|nr:ComEC/Rec2 family competence protein [Clostridia bacterium]
MADFINANRFCFMAVFFIVGISVSFFVPTRLLYILLAVFAFMAVVSLFLFKKNQGLSVIYLCLFALFISFLEMSLFCTFYVDKTKAYENQSGKISVIARDVIYAGEHGSEFLTDVVSFDGKKVSFRAVISCDIEYSPENGDMLSCVGKFVSVKEDFTSDFSLYKDRCFIGFECASVSYIGKDDGFMSKISDIRRFFENRLEYFCSAEGAALSKALLLGDKSAVPPQIKRDFTYIGASHILAISGMHLSVIMGIIALVLRSFGFSKKTVALLSFPIVAFYALVSGLSGSVMRASIMILLTSLAFLIGKERDLKISLFFAVAAVIFFSPTSVFDIGLILSFLSTLGIVLISSPVYKYLSVIESKAIKILLPIISSVLTSICAVMFSFPALWFFFGRMSLLSVISSLILTLPVEILLVISFLLLILADVPILGAFLSSGVVRFSNLVFGAASLIAKIPHAFLPLTGIFGILTVSLFIIFGVAFFFLFKRKIKYAAHAAFVLAVIAVFAIYNVYLSDSDPKTVYINQDGNEAFVIMSKHSCALCDVSGGTKNIFYSAQDLINSAYRTNIDTYIMTYYKTAHINSLENLLDKMYVKNVILPLPLTPSEENVYSQIEDLCKSRNVNFTSIDPNEYFNFDGVSFEYLTRDLIDPYKTPALSFKIECGDKKTVYVSRGAFLTDNADAVSMAVAYCDYAVFGIHGPSIKFNCAEYLYDTDDATVIADDYDLFYTSGLEDLFYKNVFVNNSTFTF